MTLTPASVADAFHWERARSTTLVIELPSSEPVRGTFSVTNLRQRGNAAYPQGDTLQHRGVGGYLQ